MSCTALRAVVARRAASVATVVALSVAAGATALATAAPAHAASAQAGGCSDVDVVFARGTGEPPGLGSAGTPLVREIRSRVPGRSVSSYAVRYPADASQRQAGTGATDLSNHVNSVAERCPDTRFVVGGYSQGASVTSIALGIPTTLGRGGTISNANSSKVAAVITFGNPLRLSGRTIRSSSPTYGSRADEFCNVGDPVCGNGFNFAAHLTYPRDGSVPRAAQFAADRINAGTDS